MEAFVVTILIVIFLVFVKKVFGDSPKLSKDTSELNQFKNGSSESHSKYDIHALSYREASDLASKFNTDTRYLIEYRDSEGNESQREITVRSISGIRIKALCHSRRALRTFRADRMSIVIDMETGEALL